jgi:membrane fusion protein (multidrug efflux system)
VVRAPFAGRLGTRSVSLGAYVSPGTRITTLDELSRVRLDFAVPENIIPRLEPGQVVRAMAPAFGERMFQGKVAVIDPRVDPVTRTARLTAEFDNPDEALRPACSCPSPWR